METESNERGESRSTESRAREDREERPRQYFQFGIWRFSVDRAQDIICEHPRETHTLPVEPWARFSGLDALDANEGRSFAIFTPRPDFNRDYALTTDLSIPLVVATLRSQETGEEFPLLIDGTHRLDRAHTEGIHELPAYALTVDESLTVREDRYYR